MGLMGWEWNDSYVSKWKKALVELVFLVQLAEEPYLFLEWVD